MRISIITFLLLFTICIQAQDNSGSSYPTDQVHNFGGLDVQPLFPGSLQNEFLKQLNIPEIDDDIDVRLYISFIIEKDGSMSGIKCERDPGFGIGRAAVNAMSAIKTKWSPGIKNGVAVRVKYSLPVKLILKADPTPVKEE